jgi:serine protease Do
MQLNSNSPEISSTRKLRNRALLGTAVALLLGGAIAGESVFVSKTPAFAEAVRVEGVQPVSFADVVEKVRPAVVSVRVRTSGAAAAVAEMNPEEFFEFPDGSPMDRFFRQFRQDRNNPPRAERRPGTSLGSGFIVSEDGYVVTNDHVVSRGQKVTVVLDDGSEYTAEAIGKDEKTDLALLKITNPDKKFTYVKFAAGDVRVGDWVVAVGNPFGLGGTVTAGIISARGREIGAGPYDDFIQIDAAVNRGNSGGPAFNLNGEVVGVNTAIFSPSGGNVGIAFAIPAAAAERIVEDLKDDGVVVRGWLGVQIQDVNQAIADSLSLPEVNGALVAEAQPGSPAEKAGLKSGDAILAVDGKAIAGPKELARMVAGMAPDSKVTVTYWRDGKKQDVAVTLGTLPTEEKVAAAEPDAAPAETSALQDFGLVLAPSEGDQGVMITEVDPNGQGAERGLQPGDVILSVGEETVSAPSQVEKSVSDAKAGGLKAVLLRIKSGEQTRFVALSFARA